MGEVFGSGIATRGAWMQPKEWRTVDSVALLSRDITSEISIFVGISFFELPFIFRIVIDLIHNRQFQAATVALCLLSDFY